MTAQQYGRYQLLERIGKGGMAEVFRAKSCGEHGFERLVAIKRITEGLMADEQFTSMFIDEAKISVGLTHANIAQVFDLGIADDQYYIALEHVHGRDLKAIFERCRAVGAPMPLPLACEVAMRVCDALDYAHNKRGPDGDLIDLVHRDISLQNILMSFEGQVKVIDFGIAKAKNRTTQTQAGMVKGKFAYMSPEQLRSLPVDCRTDVFSCGIVLYELLTGRRLFLGGSTIETVRRVRNAQVPAPRSVNPEIPIALEGILLKALARHAGDRYQSAAEFLSALEDFVRKERLGQSRGDMSKWLRELFYCEFEGEAERLGDYRKRLVQPPTVVANPRRRASTAAYSGMNAPLPTKRRALGTGAEEAHEEEKAERFTADSVDIDFDEEEDEAREAEQETDAASEEAAAAASEKTAAAERPAVAAAEPPATPSDESTMVGYAPVKPAVNLGLDEIKTLVFQRPVLLPSRKTDLLEVLSEAEPAPEVDEPPSAEETAGAALIPRHSTMSAFAALLAVLCTLAVVVGVYVALTYGDIS